MRKRTRTANGSHYDEYFEEYTSTAEVEKWTRHQSRSAEVDKTAANPAANHDEGPASSTIEDQNDGIESLTQRTPRVLSDLVNMTPRVDTEKPIDSSGDSSTP